jgi:hypothetical protein
MRVCASELIVPVLIPIGIRVCEVDVAEASSEIDSESFKETGTLRSENPAVVMGTAARFSSTFCHDIVRYGDIKISSQRTKVPKYNNNRSANLSRTDRSRITNISKRV